MAEGKETVRTVVAAVIDEQRMTAEWYHQDSAESLGGDAVVLAGEQELKIEGCKSGELGYAEPLCVDLRLGVGEEFVIVLPENRFFCCVE